MRYARFFSAFVISFVLFFACRKSPQEIDSFDKSFGGSKEDKILSMVKTPDGGYAMAGLTESTDGDLASVVSFKSSSRDAWIFQINFTGQLQWSAKLGGSGADQINAIINTADGGFIAAGLSETANGDVVENHGGKDAWIIKLDRDGRTQWKKNFGGSNDDIATSIVQDASGDYIFTGTTASTEFDNNSGDEDLWVIKLNSSGNVIWEKLLGSLGSDAGKSIVNSPDGGYLVTGDTRSDFAGRHGDEDVLVVKLASDGSLIWQKTFGGAATDQTSSVVPSLGGGFVISATSNSIDGDLHRSGNTTDTWLFEINNLGNIIWEKSYQTKETEAAAEISVNAGGYALVGTAKSGISSFAVFMTVDPDGNLLSRKLRPGAVYSQVHQGGNKYIIAGSASAGAPSLQTDARIFTIDL